MSDHVTDSLPLSQNRAAIANDGEAFLVVWQGLGRGILAARLDREGRPIGDRAFPITPSGIGASNPQLVWTGQVYFVSWVEGVSDQDLHLAQLDRSGRTLRHKIFPNIRIPAGDIAWNGSALLLTTGTSNLLLDRELNVLRQFQIPVEGFFSYKLSTAGGHFFLMTSSRELIGHHISAEGVPMHSTVIDSSPARSVSARSQGVNDVRVVWSSTSGDLKTAVVTNTGEVRDIRLIPTGQDLATNRVALIRSGQHYTVVYSSELPNQRQRFLVIRLTENGAPLDPEPVLLAEFVPYAHLVGFDGAAENAVVLIAEQVVYGHDLEAIPVRTAPRVGVETPQVISRGSTNQQWVQVATDGLSYLTTWIEYSSNWFELYAGRVNRQGERLDGRGILLQHADSSINPNHAVAFGGTDYLVVWEYGPLYGMRISRDGKKLDPQPFVIRNAAASRPQVVWNGNSFFVVWEENRRILGALVSSAGVAAPAVVLAEGRSLEWPVAAWNGREFLVGFIAQEYPPGFCGFPCFSISWSVEVIRVSSLGQPLDAVPLKLADSGFIKLASSGHEFLAIVSNGQGLWGKFIKTDLSHLEASAPFEIFRWNQSMSGFPRWDGRRYVVFFRFGFGSLFTGFRFLDRTGSLSPVHATDAPIGTDFALADTGQMLAVGTRAIPETPFSGAIRAVGQFINDAPAYGQPPSPPANVRFERNRSGGIEVWWDDRSDDENGFVVEGQFNGRWTARGITPGNVTRLTLPNPLEPFRVRAWNEGGMSAPSEVATEAVARSRAIRRP